MDRDRAFLDTNVLVYLFDTRDPVKQRRAQGLLRDIPAASIVLSPQVLGEFYWVVTRRLASPLAPQDARAAVERFARFTVLPVDKQLVLDAVALGEAASIAYWDALIVQAAKAGGCRRLLSEDLGHGQVIDGVAVENPFLGEPA